MSGDSFTFGDQNVSGGAAVQGKVDKMETHQYGASGPTWDDVTAAAGEGHAEDVAALQELAGAEDPGEDEVEAADSAMRRIGEASIDALKVAERIASKGVVAGSIMAARMLAERIAERT